MPILRTFVFSLLAALLLRAPARGADPISRAPYIGAIVVNAATGDVLFEDRADTPCYPASIVKLMVLLLALDEIDAGRLALPEKITVSGEAERMGGSQVYLAKGESFTAEDLLYALMIQSANDAAVAIAERLAGSKEAFTKRMNEKAAALGLSNTTFQSVHGLPPGSGQLPDVSTARDLARLGVEACRRPEVLTYTSTRERGFRNDTFIMRSHNGLLQSLDGCDGLKTGYFRLAGYSVVATAQRDGVRLVAAVVGSKDKKVRDAEAARLINEAFARLRRPAAAAP